VARTGKSRHNYLIINKLRIKMTDIQLRRYCVHSAYTIMSRFPETTITVDTVIAESKKIYDFVTVNGSPTENTESVLTSPDNVTIDLREWKPPTV
jgi:hypothetical protein